MQFFRDSGEEIVNWQEIDWTYQAWAPIEPKWHVNSHKGDHPDDNREHHIDLGCGTLKKGRIGIDHKYAPGVNIVMDLDDKNFKFPFPDNTIHSIISHHFFEHVGDGFIPLIDEIWRVLVPGGILRAITPLFPSSGAVQDPDHRRYFMAPSPDNCTWDSFCCPTGAEHWCSSFSVPYTKSKFERTALDYSPPVPFEKQWTQDDQRELRVTLKKNR